MAHIHHFTVNPYEENTYVLYDETGECAIVDPGCCDGSEQDNLANYIAEKKLKPVLLLNTHCHIDHVLGNKFVDEMYGLSPRFHKEEVDLLNAVIAYAPAMGIDYDPSPPAGGFLEEGDRVKFGNTELEVLFTPGHSPGSLSFYSRNDRFVIGGDVLFYGSIGRTDLPGGDFDTLIESIEVKLVPLGDEVRVYPGHGPSTTIANERKNNPFF